MAAAVRGSATARGRRGEEILQRGSVLVLVRMAPRSKAMGSAPIDGWVDILFGIHSDSLTYTLLLLGPSLALEPGSPQARPLVRGWASAICISPSAVIKRPSCDVRGEKCKFGGGVVTIWFGMFKAFQ